jgi:ABC-type nickel/cobalt efflux system permease component RcnA
MLIIAKTILITIGLLIALAIVVGLVLMILGLMRAAGNASRAEERWAAQDPEFARIVEAERRIASAPDPDHWDFERGVARD